MIPRSFIALLLMSASATLAGQSSPPQAPQSTQPAERVGRARRASTHVDSQRSQVYGGPDWQVHEYNPNFFILRQSGCIHYEKPFLYLFFGRDSALLEDTGAGKATTAQS